MLVTFSTDSYADITMFGEVALTMLKMLGHSANIPGAILAEDVPAALNRLTAAVNTEKSTPIVENEDAEADSQHVNLSTRALPLIRLFEAAAKSESDVMWK